MKVEAVQFRPYPWLFAAKDVCHDIAPRVSCLVLRCM
jgi:hypothetical protein